MGGIILVIIVVFVSVMIRKVATVALELTGLDRSTSSFQALSALTSTGFTTREAELVTSHPTRRKIISIFSAYEAIAFAIIEPFDCSIHTFFTCLCFFCIILFYLFFSMQPL